MLAVYPAPQSSRELGKVANPVASAPTSIHTEFGQAYGAPVLVTPLMAGVTGFYLARVTSRAPLQEQAQPGQACSNSLRRLAPRRPGRGTLRHSEHGHSDRRKSH
jgi:hypothetical protein